jgi:biopolymer transport protein ExbB
MRRLLRSLNTYLWFLPVLLCATAAAATEPAATDEALGQSMTIGQIIQAGGWIMYVLGGMSIAGLALVIYFFVVLRQEKVMPKTFVLELSRLIAAGDVEQARLSCRNQPSPIASVALSALDYATRTRQPEPTMLKEIIEGEGSRQAAEIQNQTTYLLDIGVIAPMVGLLGTVLGMLTAFNAVALDIARAKPIYLAAGVSQALVTTAAGLLVGIPAMMFYAYFRGHTGKLIGRLETVSADLLTQLIQGKSE